MPLYSEPSAPSAAPRGRVTKRTEAVPGFTLYEVHAATGVLLMQGMVATRAASPAFEEALHALIDDASGPTPGLLLVN